MFQTKVSDVLPDLQIGYFVSDGYTYVGSWLIGQSAKDIEEEYPDTTVLIVKWTFVAVLNENKTIKEIILHPETSLLPEDERFCLNTFVAEFDPELERKLPFESYLGSTGVEDRYFDI